MRAELSFAYPFLSLTYIAVLIGGAILFHDQITLLRIVGFVVVMAGLLLIAFDNTGHKKELTTTIQGANDTAGIDKNLENPLPSSIQPIALEKPSAQ